MEAYIPIVVISLLGLLLISTCIYCAWVFHVASVRHDSIAKEIDWIVSGTCTDPIEAISKVRKWILRYYGNAGSYPMWYENACAVMYTWCKCKIAENMGISNVQYMQGTYVNMGTTPINKSWIAIEYGGLPMIIDLERGISSTMCQGGSVTHVENVADDPIYVISVHSDDFANYIGKAARTPNYTLM